MRKITSAFSLATAMLLSLSGVQAAEMNSDTMIKHADMPSSLSHDQATDTQMNAVMDATMKNDAMHKDAVMAPKNKMMKTAAMGAKMKNAAMNKDSLPGGKQ